jgi:hypothetical protein
VTHHIRHLHHARALLIAFAVAGALLGLAYASQHASAYGTTYCTAWEPSGGSCLGPEHTLTGNSVYDDTGSNSWVCGIAQYPGGGYYGGWTCGSGSATGCYGGSQLLKAELYNDSSTWLYMHGTEYYGQACP